MKTPAILPSSILVLALAVGAVAKAPKKSAAQDQPGQATTTTKASAAPSASKTSGTSLPDVLHAMDQNAAKFRSAEAEFTWKIYNSVINDFAETDKGKIYFRRSGNRLQMSAMFTEPSSKQVIFSGDKVQVLNPGGQVDEYDTTAHKEELETFLVLGFGSSGEDLEKSFEVTDLGPEMVGAAKTAKLQLVPKAKNIQDHVPKILLWIDPTRGISIQQQIFEQSGDYRLATYSNIQLKSVPDSVFKLKGSVKKTVKH
ncbi:MAG TPA: outer-membrane lipoprotein carrier protein LolA [Terriglobales bacterium]